MRRVDALSAAATLALVSALVVGAFYYARALRDLDGRADANSGLSFSDRLIAGGNSVIVDQEAATEARALIPLSASFRVVVGPRLRNATPLTSEHVESWFRYFLLPRRPARDARWIICYGCNTAELPRYSVRWRDDEGISIGHLG
ncbi:MAG: hypothetical protein ACJ74D_04625 [Gaiellaceae bacterium]